MNSKILFILIFIFLSLGQTASAATDKAKTFVFLIHGIGSDTETTFKEMKSALGNALPKYSNRQFYFSDFNYETGNDSLNTLDFAESFNGHIGETLMHEGFDPNIDKISIIAHSQGGVVSLLWMTQSFSGAYATDYHQFVDTFVTLGTPFWGTSIVLFPLWMKLTLGKHFGDQEAREMLWGSQTINYFEKMVHDSTGGFKKYLQGINIVNIAGNALAYPNIASWSSYMDDDIAVPLPSANINHYMVKDHDTFYKPDQLIDVAEKFEISQFFVAQGLHTLPFLKGKFYLTQGLSQAPKQCVKNENCKHITYPYIWRSLLHFPLKQIDQKIMEKSKSYTIDIDLKVDLETMKPDEFEFTFTDMNGKKLTDLGHKMRLIYDRESEEYYQDGVDKRSLRFIFAGRAPSHLQQKVVIGVRHKGNRFISKRIVSYVGAQHTSFIQSSMLRFNDYVSALK